MSYKIQTNLDEYHGLLSKFVASEFPRPTTKHSALLLDLVSDEILGTKLTRIGPKASAETQVAIRKVATHWMKQGLAIPLAVPWGSKKPDGSIIDIAELSAVKVMQSLHDRVAQHYPPSVEFAIRSEDIAASWLYFDRADAARNEAKLYSDGLEALPKVLDLSYINVVRESHLTTEDAFNLEANRILPVMKDYLSSKGGVPAPTYLEVLKELGWSGPIDPDTVDYYLHLYEKLYPNKTVEERLYVLARYFSGALARKRLGLRGNNPLWGQQFIDLAFMAPIPGTDAYFSKRVNYRTLPTAYTSNHMIPWRSKGVLKIGNDNEVTPNLCHFSDLDGINKNQMTLSNGSLSVTIQADYKLV